MYLFCIFVSVADDGTQDLLGPAECDEGIRVHTIHKFAVTHAWCSISLGTFKDLFSYFGCIHFIVFVDFVDFLVDQCSGSALVDKQSRVSTCRT